MHSDGAELRQKHKAIICKQMKKSEEIRRNQKAQKHKAIGCKPTSLMSDAFTFFFMPLQRQLRRPHPSKTEDNHRKILQLSHMLLQFVHNATTDRDFKIDVQFINKPRQWQFDLLQEAATSWVIVTFRFVPVTDKNQVRKLDPDRPSFFCYAFSF